MTGGDEMAKHSIEKVMIEAHKGEGLLKNVTRGQATHEEKIRLLDLYLSLTEHKPPKGDQRSWARLTDALAIAANVCHCLELERGFPHGVTYHNSKQCCSALGTQHCLRLWIRFLVWFNR